MNEKSIISEDGPASPVPQKDTATAAVVDAADTAKLAPAGGDSAPSDTAILATQRGDLAYLQRASDEELLAFDSGGASPLHWAALNGYQPIISYLVTDRRVPVDIRPAGDDHPTPALWAARSGKTSALRLLVKLGADVSAKDSNGNTALHLATFCEASMTLLYLCSLGVIPVDAKDNDGRTALLWAAYMGDAESVQVLLKFGANPGVYDSIGFTPLHWIASKGLQKTMELILDAAAARSFGDSSEGNLFQRIMSTPPSEYNQPRTPLDVARENNSLSAFNAAVHNSTRRREDSIYVIGTVTKSRAVNMLLLFLSIVVTSLIIFFMGKLPWYMGVPLSIATFMIAQFTILRQILKTKRSMELARTPYYSGIFQTTLFMGLALWLSTLLPVLMGHPDTSLSNFLLFVFAIVTIVCYYITALGDPGFTIKPTVPTQCHGQVDKLLDRNLLSIPHFCLYCLAIKPVRAAHCHQCDRCVTRIDHHCPWTLSKCVGANNHRAFVGFVASLNLTIMAFLYNTNLYFAALVPVYEPVEGQPCYLGDTLCSYWQYDGIMMAFSVWIILQAIWSSWLLIAQLYQIAVGKTTVELLKGWKYSTSPSATYTTVSTINGYEVVDHSRQARDARDKANQAPLEALSSSWPDPSSGDSGNGNGNGNGGGGKSFLGMERWMCPWRYNRHRKSATDGSRAQYSLLVGRGSDQPNGSSVAVDLDEDPFDTGVTSNCVSFWSAYQSGELNGADWRSHITAADVIASTSIDGNLV
ncbi:hypothetical protein GQ42DRAFT_164434 [Ramicandelaber brevisporus]|nr:hypothetical protein GQ42DRAFT_164434 [Ramicandelaber brevisporus]